MDTNDFGSSKQWQWRVLMGSRSTAVGQQVGTRFHLTDVFLVVGGASHPFGSWTWQRERNAEYAMKSTQDCRGTCESALAQSGDLGSEGWLKYHQGRQRTLVRKPLSGYIQRLHRAACDKQHRRKNEV